MLKREVYANLQADRLIRQLQSSNRLLKSELQATTTSFKQALHAAASRLQTGNLTCRRLAVAVIAGHGIQLQLCCHQNDALLMCCSPVTQYADV